MYEKFYNLVQSEIEGLEWDSNFIFSMYTHRYENPNKISIDIFGNMIYNNDIANFLLTFDMDINNISSESIYDREYKKGLYDVKVISTYLDINDNSEVFIKEMIVLERFLKNNINIVQYMIDNFLTYEKPSSDKSNEVEEISLD